MVGEHHSQSHLPHERQRASWRAASVAYRAVRRTGAGDHLAWLSARAAVLDCCPDLDATEAGKRAADAIVFASVHYPSWFWRGVGS